MVPWSSDQLPSWARFPNAGSGGLVAREIAAQNHAGSRMFGQPSEEKSEEKSSFKCCGCGRENDIIAGQAPSCSGCRHEPCERCPKIQQSFYESHSEGDLPESAWQGMLDEFNAEERGERSDAWW